MRVTGWLVTVNHTGKLFDSYAEAMYKPSISLLHVLQLPFMSRFYMEKVKNMRG